MFLLPEDDHMRRLPDFIDPTDAVRSSTLLLATDIISITFDRLIKLINSLPYGRAFQLTMHTERQMFADSWSLIDQIHLVRQLLRTDNAARNLGPDAEQWLDRTEPATRLRNGMDHIVQNARNLSKRSGGSPPLFGGLTIFRTPEPDRVGLEPTPYQLLTFGTDIPLAGASWSPPPIPATSSHEVAYVHLTAFGHHLDISEAVRSLEPVLRSASLLAAAQINDHVRATSMSEAELQASRNHCARDRGFILEGPIMPRGRTG